MSQATLARTLGTSQPTLSAYEKGHEVPSADTLNRIVVAYGYQLRAVTGTRFVACPLPGDDSTAPLRLAPGHPAGRMQRGGHLLLGRLAGPPVLLPRLHARGARETLEPPGRRTGRFPFDAPGGPLDLPFVHQDDLAVSKLSTATPLDLEAIENRLVALRGPTMYPRLARLRQMAEK
jgi:hypothetical protein